MACPIQFLINPIEFKELSVKVDKILRIMERSGMTGESVPVMKRVEKESGHGKQKPKSHDTGKLSINPPKHKGKSSKPQPSAPAPSPQTLPKKKVIDFDDDDAEDVYESEIESEAEASVTQTPEPLEQTSGEGNEEELAMIEHANEFEE